MKQIEVQTCSFNPEVQKFFLTVIQAGTKGVSEKNKID